MKLATRRMDEMTSREVEFYLEGGGDLAFVPFGPVSGHGAFIPMGIHAHWAHALSVLLAQRADGLVFPPVFACYAGATRTFRGTVSFPIAEQVAALRRVALTLHGQGFRRTVLVAGTHPEMMGGTVAARELFDDTETPFWCIEAARLLDTPEVKALYEGYPGNFGETLIGLASLKILGRERPIPAAKWAIPAAKWAKEIKKDDDPDQPAGVAGDVIALRRTGAVGFRYHEEANHGNHGTAGIEWKGRLDVDLAVEVLEKSADALVPVLRNLSRYTRWLEARPPRPVKAKQRLTEC